MKSLIVYTSQTGFTKKYARWIAERVNADLLDVKDAKKKKEDYFNSFETIVYGGWANAGKVAGSKWFFEKVPAWKDKRLAIFCVGGCQHDDPHTEMMMSKILTDEQKQFIRTFYCPGGFAYEKMNTASRLAMKMYARMLKKKKDATEEDKKMAEMISSSFDITDISFTDPIVAYIQG